MGTSREAPQAFIKGKMKTKEGETRPIAQGGRKKEREIPNKKEARNRKKKKLRWCRVDEHHLGERLKPINQLAIPTYS